jgi:catechol 2,3-dioxygenase-like lactoylglutathione lyase family enzyme
VIRFANPLVFVADIEVSRKFYQDVLNLQVVESHHNFVLFADGFAIHHGNDLLDATFGIGHSQSAWGRNNLVLYFEAQPIAETFERLARIVDLIHPLRMESWGQQIFRFYDPDRHIIEIGDVQERDRAI